MKTKTALAALLFLTVAACAPAQSEVEEPESEQTEVEETVELDPEKMTGSLNQEQSKIFTEYALEKVEGDICEFVQATLPKEDLNGVKNLVMDVAGYSQEIESIRLAGIMSLAIDECDY